MQGRGNPRPFFMSDATETNSHMPEKRTRKPHAVPAQGLRFSRDTEKGLARRGEPGKFEYVDARGEKCTDEATLERIRKLAIPPAWTDVWICRDERGHLQATGRDARGRKQYRYHAAWRETREADKFGQLEDFAKALPAIRRRVRADLALDGLPRRKVLAAIVRLLESTCIRIGNERYAEENDSFGLTTMRNRHVRVSGARVEFKFRGKSGKFHRIAVDDPRLARIVSHCRDLPGEELFQYLDENDEVQSISSSDVNDYLKEIAGREITTKNFRTWVGSVFVAAELARAESPVSATKVNAAIREAAARLGNTPAICRKSYVHPRVLDPATWQEPRRRITSARRVHGLRSDEAAFLRLLRMPRPDFVTQARRTLANLRAARKGRGLAAPR
jgi:DNA topoisomerase-1